MSFPNVLQLLLPTLVPICVGYAVARWVGVSMQPIGALLRTVFVPAILFTALQERMQLHTFMLLVVIGAAMALGGIFVVRHTHRFLKPRVDHSAAVLNIACFSLPLFALSMSSMGLATACALFVGVALASCVMEVRSVGTTVFTSFGEKGIRVEQVAELAIGLALAFHGSDAAIDEHFADQLLLPMAIGKGGIFTTTEPSSHARTQIEILRTFLDVDADFTTRDERKFLETASAPSTIRPLPPQPRVLPAG